MQGRIRLRHSRLKNLLRRRKISQNRWAQKLGLGRAHLSLLVNGKRPYPSSSTRVKLLKGLGVPFEELFEVESTRPHEVEPAEFHRLSGVDSGATEHKDDPMHEHYLNLRFAIRSLFRQPLFSLTVLLVLALGIGATTTMLSVVESTLLRTLPFRDPDQLLMVWEHHEQTGDLTNPVSPADYIIWREQTESFQELAAFVATPLNLTGTARPLRAAAGLATPNFFTLLGASPVLGRNFDDSDANECILSHGFWQRYFGGRTDLAALKLNLEGRESKVVGVMPADFDLPAGVDLWVKMVMTPQHRNFYGRYMAVVGRLADQKTIAQAQSEMDTLAERLEAEQPEKHAGWGVYVLPLKEYLVGSYRTTLLVLLAAVGLVLLIACTNLSSLQLARASTRLHEFSIRTALGARRWTLLRQLLTESVLLGIGGGVVGLWLARMALLLIPSLVPFQMPAFLNLSLRPWIVMATLGISCCAGLAFGLLPAFQLTQVNLNSQLQEKGRGTVAGAQRLRGWLVSAEIALAVVLLVGAGLLLRSLRSLQAVDPGFDVEGLYSVELSLPRLVQSDPASQTRFFSQVVEDLAQIPGIDEAGAISWLPLGGIGSSTSFYPLDRPLPPPAEIPSASIRSVTSSYFETVGMKVLQGRALDRSLDREDQPPHVVINAAVAQQFWPHENPLGKRLMMWWGKRIEAEVVGVVNDARLNELEVAPGPTLYWSIRQIPNPSMTILVHSELDQTALTATVRSVVSAIDSDQPVSNLVAMSEVISKSLQPRRFPMLLLGVFALAAIGLASIGIYGLISYGVVRRTGEIGVRMAFGADRRAVLLLLLRQGIGRVLPGSLLGLLLALGLSRYLQSMVYQIGVIDPWTYLGVVGLVLSVSSVAILLPARHALSIDPADALRVQ